MSDNDQIILPTSPEAASYRTDIKGWISRNGRFYGDGSGGERTARYDGSTHNICIRCGSHCEKGWTSCQGCRDVLDHERWEKLELVEWDGVTPLTLYKGDQYFFDTESIYDYAETNDLKVSELDLVICIPNLAREVDQDYWCDEIAEDGELPSWLEDALEQFNKIIREHQNEPLSWYPGKQRVILPDNPS